MAINFTAVGNYEFKSSPKGRVAITTQGVDANDFTWEIQYTLDAGTTWTPYENTVNASTSFTGSKFKVLLVGTRENRFALTSMGTATSVNIELY